MQVPWILLMAERLTLQAVPARRQTAGLRRHCSPEAKGKAQATSRASRKTSFSGMPSVDASFDSTPSHVSPMLPITRPSQGKDRVANAQETDELYGRIAGRCTSKAELLYAIRSLRQ